MIVVIDHFWVRNVYDYCPLNLGKGLPLALMSGLHLAGVKSPTVSISLKPNPDWSLMRHKPFHEGLMKPEDEVLLFTAVLSFLLLGKKLQALSEALHLSNVSSVWSTHWHKVIIFLEYPHLPPNVGWDHSNLMKSLFKFICFVSSPWGHRKSTRLSNWTDLLIVENMTNIKTQSK